MTLEDPMTLVGHKFLKNLILSLFRNWKKFKNVKKWPKRAVCPFQTHIGRPDKQSINQQKTFSYTVFYFFSKFLFY